MWGRTAARNKRKSSPTCSTERYLLLIMVNAGNPHSQKGGGEGDEHFYSLFGEVIFMLPLFSRTRFFLLSHCVTN